MARDDARHRAAELVKEHGKTYAEQAGIRLQDKPAPLYQLVTLSMLLSVPIRSDVAVAAANELFAAGWRTARKMAESTWQERVDALGRAHYKRYDEGTSTALGKDADLIMERWGGDLRKLREEAHRDPTAIRAGLQRLARIGPIGAEIFCREVQGVWPELRPTFGERALRGAHEAGLPENADELAALVPPEDLPRLAAGLVRRTLGASAGPRPPRAVTHV
jgi:hypothetical protein